MEIKTYGAPRYMDWVAQIKAGSATVRVHFTGGALTVYGVTPAEYSTSNPFVQKVIEQSQYFKEGRIVMLRTTPIDDPTPMTTPKRSTKVHEERTSPPPTSEKITNEEPISLSEAGRSQVEEILSEVEVSCLQDAQDYLQHHFGISSYKVRSKVSAQKAAREHGVKFVGAGFNTEEEVTES